jgi:chromosome segregation ATPase
VTSFGLIHLCRALLSDSAALMEAIKEAKREADERVAAIQDEANDVRKNLSGLEEGLKEKEDEAQKLVGELEREKDGRAEAQGLIEKLESSLKEKEDEAQKLMRELEKLESSLAAMSRASEASAKDLEEERAKCLELEGRAREVEMRMMEMESGEKRGRDRRVEELEEQVVSLQDQVKRAEEGLSAERGARREAESAAEGVAEEVNYSSAFPCLGESAMSWPLPISRDSDQIFISVLCRYRGSIVRLVRSRERSNG